MTIVMPLPSRDLSPNSRVYWRRHAEAKKVLREHAHLAALDIMNVTLLKPPRWKRATAKVRWFAKEARYTPDRDNIIAWLKAAFDGFADAGVWENDRNVTHLPAETAVDKANARVEIDVFEESENG